jgi:uncharacterized protein (DUF1800 family)
MTDRSMDRNDRGPKERWRRPASDLGPPMRPGAPPPERPRRPPYRRVSPPGTAGSAGPRRPVRAPGETLPPGPIGHLYASIEQPTSAERGQDEADEVPTAKETGGRSRRRAILAGVAGTGVAAAGWVALKGLPWSSSKVGLNPAAPRRAADPGGFANRDESFSKAAGGPEAPPLSPDLQMVFPTASEAAQATEVEVPTILATDDPVIHLLRRTTFGPTPALVDEVHAKGIDAWLAEQLQPTELPDDEADQAWAAFPLASRSPAEIRSSIERHHWDAMLDHGRGTLARQIWSTRQLYEVVVDFWANHLNVPMPEGASWDVGPSYHTGVIRQHALGSFTDMLLAAMRHPAMLRYLNNNQSNKRSVNENLGRELLELHTVGVGSGYSEEDVRQSAYILTGRTLYNRDGPEEEATFRYDPDRHWTGPVQVLDFSHENATGEGGLEVGDAYLRYLASHPATANTIARKLVVRFVSDNPPETLVERLASTYLEAGTSIGPVLDIMFRSREFWASVGQKSRRPLENVVASARTLGVRPSPTTSEAVERVYSWLGQLGHRPLAWRAPNGYPDVHAAWRSVGGVLKMWNSHRDLVRGWEEGFVHTPADQLIGDHPQSTVGEYVDSLCQRLCLQTFQPQHRDGLIWFVGADAATPTTGSELADLVEDLVPMVLHSPYFALR